jgi:hypothetical protein
MLIPKKNRKEVYKYLFRGACSAERRRALFLVPSRRERARERGGSPSTVR